MGILAIIGRRSTAWFGLPAELFVLVCAQKLLFSGL